MNEYFKIFQNVTQSIELITLNPHSSIEIQKSASSFHNSLTPCYEELKQSAARLKGLLKPAFNDLDYAEDVWDSKPKIVQAPTNEIWQQLGEISGQNIKIKELANKFREETIKQINTQWNKLIESLRQKWFIDNKGNQKKGIGWGEKAGFINQVYPQVFDKYYQLLKKEVDISLDKLSLKIMFIDTSKSQMISSLLELLDSQQKNEIKTKFQQTSEKIAFQFSKTSNDCYGGFPKQEDVSKLIIQDVNTLINKGLNDIYWEDVLQFKIKVSVITQKLITTIFNYEVNLIDETFSQTIAFYNEFLEQQQRYQQETLEQRQSEKAWIEHQRWQLKQLQDGIQTILDS